MRHLVARIGRLAAALGLAACVTIAPQLDMPRPAYLTGDKMAGSATLVMSESSLSLSRVVELPTGCIGDIQFVDVPLGRSFQRAVQAQFGPLFERLEISSIPRPEADYTVDITLEQVGVRFGCPASPGTYAEARGSMRLIDNRGAELWRAQTTRKRQDMGMYMTEFDRAVGQDISKAMGGLIEEWGQDFVRGGLFAQRRIGGGGAQVAGGAGEMAFWDAIKNSTNPGDYRAYIETYPRGQFVALARVRAGLGPPAPAAAIPAPLPMPGAGPAPVTSYVPPATQFAPPAAAAPPPPPQPMPVVAERRVALVIGNASYARLGVLRNPLNDARAVSASLRRVGFDVATVENGDHRTMMRAISEFGNRIGNGGVGLFYYAGHAVQVRGANYLIPVDANIQAESEVDFLAVNAGLAFAQYDKANAKLGVTILDSCRDNPLPQAFRSMSRGLAVVGNAPPGSLVVYATGPGQVAADGSGANSVFTEALLQNLERPGIKAQDMFNAVAVSVSQKSQGRQVPWISATGIQDDFFFRR